MKVPYLFAVLLALSAPSFGAEPPQPANRYAASIVPAERFEVGGMLVERHGQRGTPLILVPGLVSGAWVWQDTLRRFAGEHVIYVVTLPGFDGRAPAPGKPMEAAQQALRELIVSRKLAKPVLIGHSLGGTLAIALAEQEPDLVGGVVTIDGLPVFPTTESVPPAQRAQMAEAMKARLAGIKPAAFAAQQQQYMRGIGVTDMSRADELAKLSANSDPAAVVQYMGDTLALDLRAGLAKIKAPVLVIAPYFDVDAEGAGITQDMKTGYYKSLMQGTPQVSVVAVSPARHFAMFDQPQQVADAIRAYLQSL